jgi:hypothetical protein
VVKIAIKLPQLVKPKKIEEEAFKYELEPGDVEIVKEIKAWIKEGKTEHEIVKQLEASGFLDYHIDFLMKAATGEESQVIREKIKGFAAEEERIARERNKLILAGIVVLVIIAAVWLALRARTGG